MKNFRMPVGGPALVENLGLELRMKIVRLLANDLQHVTLPGLDRSVLGEEPEEIFLRMWRNGVANDHLGQREVLFAKDISVGLRLTLPLDHLPRGIRFAHQTFVYI